MAHTEFTYRLPLTYIRVGATQSETPEEITGKAAIACTAIVTTETAADPLSELKLRLTPGPNSTIKSTWALLPDGRLTGAELGTTIQRYSTLGSVLQVGTFALSALLPFLVPGPAGVAASLGALAAGSKLRHVGKPNRHLLKPETAEPSPQHHSLWVDEHGISRLYEQEFKSEFDLLARYRAALLKAREAHATAVTGGYLDDIRVASSRLRHLRVELEKAEAGYQAWLASKVSTHHVDKRFRIETLPTSEELRRWCDRPSSADLVWASTALTYRTAITIDAVESVSAAPRPHAPTPFTREVETDLVYLRPPRPVILKVWSLKEVGDRYISDLVETQRLQVAFPGNEGQIQLIPENQTTGSIGLTFDENGALTKLTNEAVDPSVQRSKDIGTAITGISDAGKAGFGLREALLPPSATDQADAAEALAKLAPKEPKDPALARLEEQLAETQLKAKLRVAEQLATASSPPIVVRVEEALD